MKKILVSIFLVSVFISTFSQSDTLHLKTVFKEKAGSTFLVAQLFQLTEFDGSPTLMLGAGGGKIFNHKFLLGGGGYGTIAGVPVRQKNYSALNLQENISHNFHFGYGGFWTGYMFRWHSIFHLTPSMFWAAGAISIRRNDTNESVNTNFVFILQPMLEFEFNLTEFMRIGIAPQYRFVANTKFAGYKNSDFSGFGALFLIKFGAF